MKNKTFLLTPATEKFLLELLESTNLSVRRMHDVHISRRAVSKV